MGLAYFSTGKMGFEALGLGFGDLGLGKKVANDGNGKDIP